jgi:hypothetical protein
MAVALFGCAKPPPLSQIDQTIFQRSCEFSACHEGSGAQSGLNLQMMPYDQLVNVKAFEAPTRIRVIPGDPDNSYLMEKLSSATPMIGSRMPPNSDPLPDDEITQIHDWIAGGAQNN